MTKTFTQDDLIRYVYLETSNEENRAIENALMCNTILLDKYHEILLVTGKLSMGAKDPSENTVNNILNYSKSLNSHSIS